MSVCDVRLRHGHCLLIFALGSVFFFFFSFSRFFVRIQLPSIEEDFTREMEALEKCSSIASDGTKLLTVGEGQCFRRGATSSLMEGNFLLRSVYSSQIRHWYGVILLCPQGSAHDIVFIVGLVNMRKFLTSHPIFSSSFSFSYDFANKRVLDGVNHKTHRLEFFDRSQFLFLSSDDLHEDPQRVVDQVADFIGLERQPLDMSIDMHEYAPHHPATQAVFVFGVVALRVAGQTRD